jgi:hypothetical protein
MTAGVEVPVTAGVVAGVAVGDGGTVVAGAVGDGVADGGGVRLGAGAVAL